MSDPVIVPGAVDYDVWAAASREPAKPEAAPAEQAPEKIQQSAEPEKAPESQETKDAPGDIDSERRRSGVQKRIDELTRDKYQNAAILAERDRQLAEVTRKLEELSKPKAPEVPAGEPKIDDFDTLPEYQHARDAWLLKSLREEMRKEDEDRRLRDAADQRVRNWAARVTEAAKTTEDMLETLQSVKATPEMFEVIADSENGPQVAYYLGKNPWESARLSQLTIPAMAREIGRIEAILQNQDKKQQDAPPQGKVISSAPPPPKPVSVNAKTELVYSDDMSIDDFIRWREADLTKRGRRL